MTRSSEGMSDQETIVAAKRKRSAIWGIRTSGQEYHFSGLWSKSADNAGTEELIEKEDNSRL